MRIAGMVGRGILILLISGLLGAALVRMAPGGDVDEQELDPRLRRESIEILRRQRAAERNSLNYYPRFIAGLLRGDGGHSALFGAPVAQLIRERIGTTARSVFAGLIIEDRKIVSDGLFTDELRIQTHADGASCPDRL